MNLEPSNQTNLFYLNDFFLELTNLHLSKSLPNKILLSGEKGIGKCTLAYHVINFILSSDEDHPYDYKSLKINPENKSFKLVKNKSNPNLILIDVVEEKKNIDINQIRNLILTLNKSSFNSKARFVLIDNIELLNLNSVNALLKVIEEPNDNVFFILINNNKNILPTLKSRCLNFKISLTSSDSLKVVDKLLSENLGNIFNVELLSKFNTPGNILRIINFADRNGIDTKDISLKKFILNVFANKTYKKETSDKDLIYSFLELYFRKNISVKNINLINMYKYFLKKINQTKKFNLDEESLFMEFEDKILNE